MFESGKIYPELTGITHQLEKQQHTKKFPLCVSRGGVGGQALKYNLGRGISLWRTGK